MSKKVFLKDAVPDIEKYWDYEKNQGVDLDSLGASQSTKVWTFCPVCGTSVQRNVRFTWTKDESGVGHVICCRTCGKHNGNNSLVYLCPDIKKYWSYDKNEHNPEYYTVGSGKKVYIKCPSCGKDTLKAITDITQKMPDGSYRITSCLECSRTVDRYAKSSQESNIAKWCPDIHKYWDYAANDCAPEDVLRSSKKKVYIHCPSCNKLLYRAVHNSFVRTGGNTLSVMLCQKCAAGKSNYEKGLQQNGNVLESCPEIKEWWDYSRNHLNPDEVSRGSHYKAVLVCPACQETSVRDMHEVISLRCDGKYHVVACPKCGYSSSKGDPEDNLVKLVPEIVDWWDYHANRPFRPEQFSKGSQFSAFLICPDCGLRLYTGIHSLLKTLEDGTVVIRHKGKCSKLLAQSKDNNLVKLYPEITKWWNYEKNAPHKPEDFTTGSRFSAYFICPECGVESYRRISDAFDLKDNGIPCLFDCPYCAGAKAIPGVNSLKALYPELASECVSDVDTDKINPKAYNSLKWKCPTCHGTYSAVISLRVNGNGCPYCGDVHVLPGLNDLKTLEPELAKEWSLKNDFGPESVRRTRHLSVIWQCPTCHGEYNYPIDERHVGDDSCPYCNDRRALPGYNDLATVDSELAKEWASSNLRGPDTVLRTSKISAVWQCPTCHSEYNYLISERYVGDDSCPYCNDRKVLPGYNSFKVKHPEIVEKEWYWLGNLVMHMDPDQHLDTSLKEAFFECPICHKQYLMSLRQRAMKEKRHQNPCPFCNGRRQMLPYGVPLK